MKMRMLLVLCAALALTVGAATATAGNGNGGHGNGGNSANAKKCQKGGWKTLYRSDGTPFKNQGACVSYAAKGGTLTTKTQSQLDCEAAGGVFSTDPATDLSGIVGGTFLWSCHGPNVLAAFGTLSNDCFTLDGGTAYGVTGLDPTVPSCKGP